MFQFENHNELVHDYRVVVPTDPALDKGDPKRSPKKYKTFLDALRKYADTGDASLLPIKSNQKPSVWVMAHLRGKSLVKARKAITLAGELLENTSSQNPALFEELNYELCRMSLRAVENIGEEGGEYVFQTVMEGGLEVVSDDEMARVFEIKPRASVPYHLGMAVKRRVVGNPLS